MKIPITENPEKVKKRSSEIPNHSLFDAKIIYKLKLCGKVNGIDVVILFFFNLKTGRQGRKRYE